MHIILYKVIFVTTICSIFSIVYTQPKKEDCNELLMNITKSLSNKNETNSMQKDSKENITNISKPQNDQKSYEVNERNTAIIESFMTKGTNFSKLNISLHTSSNENVTISALSLNDKNQNENYDYEIKNLSKSDTTEGQMSSTEIILSEITNLSRNDGDKDIPLGQKIKFQRSAVESEMEINNLAGREILQNASGVCGYLFGKRISFADPTTLMEFPWTALLLYNTNIRYHCGGSLITKRYVLTAAHCVTQEFYELTGVRLGEYDISEPIDCAPDLVGANICATTVDANVIKIIVHHHYSELSFKNDIALLRLDNEYFGRSFYPICLPTPEMMYAGRQATVAGWGATEKALRSTILLKAAVPIFDISKCRDIYRYNKFNDTTEICASGANAVDVCKGDSGGAIFYSDTVRGKNRFFQLGIISLGVRGCGDKRFLPAVFTKVNAFYKWIGNNLEY